MSANRINPGPPNSAFVHRHTCKHYASNVEISSTEGLLRSIGATAVSAWAAHALAWAAGVWLAFGPAYAGQSAVPALPGEPGGEVTGFSATAVEVNGLQIILLLLVPVMLTGIALLALRLTDSRQTRLKILFWSPSILLLGFCAIAILSIGAFYLPAAFALLVAAVAGSKQAPESYSLRLEQILDGKKKVPTRTERNMASRQMTGQRRDTCIRRLRSTLVNRARAASRPMLPSASSSRTRPLARALGLPYPCFKPPATSGPPR